MKKIREIMRLYMHVGLSQRQIAQALGISRPVVSDYIVKINLLTNGFHFWFDLVIFEM